MTATIHYPTDDDFWLPLPKQSHGLTQEEVSAWCVAAGETMVERGASEEAAEVALQALIPMLPSPENVDRCVYFPQLARGFVPVEFDVKPVTDGWRDAFVAIFADAAPEGARVEVEDVEIAGLEESVRVIVTLVQPGAYRTRIGWAGQANDDVVSAVALTSNPVATGEVVEVVPDFLERMRLVAS